MMVKRFLAILVCFVLVMGTMPVLADTADIQYTVKSTKVELTDPVTTTPAEYKFKIDGGTKEYILLDSAYNSGKREFFVMTEHLASKNTCDLSNPSYTNYYYFIKPDSGASWDGTGTNYAYDPQNPNSLASVINSDAVVDSMVDESIQTYVQSHTWKSEEVWGDTEKPAKAETVSKYALPAVSEYLAYKEKIGTIATESGKTSARQWYFRTPFCDGTGCSYAMNKDGNTIRNWSFSDYWNTSFRVCFYVSEDFFKKVKLDTASLGAEIVETVGFKSFMTKAEMLALGYTEAELEASGIFPGVSHATNPGTNVTNMPNETPTEYKFSLPGSNRTYSIIDTYYKNDGTREFYAVTDYTASSGIATETLADNRYRFAATAEYTWDGSSEKYIWDPTDTNTLAGFINSSGFISEMIDEAVNTYVVEHSYKFEPASEATASAKAEVSSKYALLSLSELNAYKDRIGVIPCEYNVSTDEMTTTSNSWWVRTPAVAGGAGAMVWHKTSAKPSWQSSTGGWGKTIRPSFHLSESFFKNVKLDISKLGYEVIDMVDFESIMTKAEALELGYTEGEWKTLCKKDISVQTNDIVKISCDGGTRVKSGYTLTVSGVGAADTVQFYASDDGVYGYPIDGATASTLKLANDLEKKYIAAVVTKFDGSKLVSNKLYCGENLPSYSGWVNVNFVNEFDDADYKLKLDSQPGEFTLVDYNAATNEMLLMSGIAYSGTEPESAHYQSTDNIQKYDAADENSIAYEINQADFISTKLIAADYHSYIAEKYWETEKYCNGSDSVTKAKVALPSLTELNSTKYLERIGKKIGTGTGRQAGYKLRTPYSNATGFYYMRNGSAQESAANSVYYPSRVEFWLNSDVLKVLKIDVANSGSKALAELNLPSVLSVEEAQELGYTYDELAILGYYEVNKETEVIAAEGSTKVHGSIYFETAFDGVEVMVAVYDQNGILKDCKAESLENVSAGQNAFGVTLTDALEAEDVVKLFVFESAANLKPVMASITKTVTALPARVLGRYEIVDGAYSLNWPNSGVEFTFTGTNAKIYFDKVTGTSYFTPIVDGVAGERVQVTQGWTTIASGLSDAEHTVKFVRSSEASGGRTWASAISANAVQPTQAKERLIEFYGDSYTAGYGNLSNDTSEWGGVTNTDAQKAYSTVIADYFNADSNLIAYSGKGILANGTDNVGITMAEMSGLADIKVNGDETTPSNWDFIKATPDMVVIFLGTNDYIYNAEMGEDFGTAYTSFIGDIRERYGDVKILCLSKATGSYGDVIQSAVETLQTAGDENIAFYQFDAFGSSGAKWHPTAAEAALIADQLKQPISDLMSW